MKYSSYSCVGLFYTLSVLIISSVDSFLFPQIALKSLIASSSSSNTSTIDDKDRKVSCDLPRSKTTTSLHQSTTNNDPMSSQSNQQNQGFPRWYQKQISITAPSRGCHLITADVLKAVQGDLSAIKIGMANLFIQHTSASLTINENADPDVRRDMEVALNKIVPATWTRDGTFHHTMEGEDDMPGHVKTSLIGPSLNIPIRNGRLALGTWQGIYLNEHRDQGGWGGGHSRNIIITLQGQG